MAAKQFTIRLHDSLLERTDALIEWAGGTPTVTLSGQASRADVMRAALHIGLEELERQAERDKRSAAAKKGWANKE